MDYLGVERSGLSESIVEEELSRFRNALTQWKGLLESSFFSEKMRSQYEALISQR